MKMSQEKETPDDSDVQGDTNNESNDDIDLNLSRRLSSKHAFS